METINKYRSPIVLGLLVMFVLLFTFYMLAIRPVNQDLLRGDAELSQLQQERTLLTTKLNELKGSSEAKTSSEEAALAAIPQGDDSEGLILDLQAIGNSSHARLKDIGFSLTETNGVSVWTGISAEAAGKLKEIKMSAIVEGGYTEIHDWLKELHALPRVVSVDSFAFQQPYELTTALKPGSIVTANIAFTAYYEDYGKTASTGQ
ncbi:Pilus assembly protein, PilO [compost metagenome]